MSGEASGLENIIQWLAGRAEDLKEAPTISAVTDGTQNKTPKAAQRGMHRIAGPFPYGL